MTDVTRILSKIKSGDRCAADELLPVVYAELRRLAAVKMANENPGHTLQATALVHDAYIRLVDRETAEQWNSRAHFFAATAEAMRRILIEQARKKRGPKAGGGLHRVALSGVDPETIDKDVDILALNDALDALATQDSRAAQVVKLRYFAGLTSTRSPRSPERGVGW